MKFIAKVVVATFVVLIILGGCMALALSGVSDEINEDSERYTNCIADVMDEANAKIKSDYSNLSQVTSWQMREQARRCKI